MLDAFARSLTRRLWLLCVGLSLMGCPSDPEAPIEDSADVPLVAAGDAESPGAMDSTAGSDVEAPVDATGDPGPELTIDVPAHMNGDVANEDVPVESDTPAPPDAGPDVPDVEPDVPDVSPEAPDVPEPNDIPEPPDVAPDVPEVPKVWLDLYPLQAQFPEGGIYDSETHAFYVGSLGDGSVHRVDANTGDETVLFSPTAEGVWWTLGMDMDEENGLLWVCAMDDQSDFTDDDPPYDGYIWVFDVLTGEQVGDYNLSDVYPTATCTDVTLAADGTAYVVDREHPNIYRIKPNGGMGLFTTDKDLSGLVAGQNAVVVLPDQSALLVVVYLYPDLLRVDLTTGAVTSVDIDGSFFDAAPLAGADGLALAGDSAWVVFTSELVRVKPTTSGWGKAKATEVDIDYGMTDVVTTPNGLYLLNGQAVGFATGIDSDPFQLVRFTGDL